MPPKKSPDQSLLRNYSRFPFRTIDSFKIQNSFISHIYTAITSILALPLLLTEKPRISVFTDMTSSWIVQSADQLWFGGCFGYRENRKTPISPENPLFLTPEEIVYLTLGLNCLTLVDSVTKTRIDPVDFWKKQLETAGFMKNYIVFHYFASRGYSVKPGLQYGLDYSKFHVILVLYEKGPEFNHSEFGVLITDELNILEMQRIVRVLNKVKKKFMWVKVDLFENSTVYKTVLTRSTVEYLVYDRFLPELKA